MQFTLTSSVYLAEDIFPFPSTLIPEMGGHLVEAWAKKRMAQARKAVMAVRANIIRSVYRENSN